ncbi:MAG: transporter permease [Paenibacillaceae bacterium]|nr:transporter permease [Paenibacillaceae bacterium]
MVKGMEDRLVNGAVYAILAAIAVLAVFPVLYVVSVSITPYAEVLKNGGYVIIPRAVTLDAYRHLLSDSELPRAFGITAFLTSAGSLINLLGIMSMAYPLSRRNLPGRSFWLMYIFITMLFSGGLIPTYLVVKGLGLVNTVWAMIIPGAIVTFHVLIMKTFFENIPSELFEAARMDGAKELRILAQLVLPLSLPVIMTIALFNMVGHWNTFFTAVLYVTDRTLHPLQVVVRRMLLETSQDQLTSTVQVVPTLTLQMAAVVLVSAPMIIIYPFIQKHFTKGMLVGSIKG